MRCNSKTTWNLSVYLVSAEILTREMKILEYCESSLDGMDSLKFLNITSSVSVWLGTEFMKERKTFDTCRTCGLKHVMTIFISYKIMSSRIK